MIGDDMARRDICRDPLFATDAVVMAQLSGHHEERGFLHFGRFQPGDQTLRALLGREKGAAAARDIVEAKCNPLLRLRS
jgi:hypothetical protein